MEKRQRSEQKTARKVLGVFTHAFLINLDEDVDRLHRTEGRLNEVGIVFERYPAVKFADKGNHEWVGMRGCNASHLAVVQEADTRGYESVLIMEDDVIFRDNFLQLWNRVARQVADLEYDIFYGYNWFDPSGTPERLRVIPLQSTWCTHFWAVHSRFYQAFIASLERNETLQRALAIDDCIFTSENARIYGLSYNLVGQDQGLSRTMDGEGHGVCWHLEVKPSPLWRRLARGIRRFCRGKVR